MSNKTIHQWTELAEAPNDADEVAVWDASESKSVRVPYSDFMSSENMWDVAANVISPHTDGDDLDMLTGTITTPTAYITTLDTNVAAAGVTLAGTTLAADGTDANISITLTPKGTGVVTSSKGYAMTGAVTTGLSISGATTTGISITGNATDAIKVLTGIFATGLNLAGTLTTGVTVGACTTAFTITGAVTTGYNLAGNATDGFKVSSGTVTNGFNVAGGTVTTGFLCAGAATSGLSITGATTQAINITGSATDAIKILTGTYTNAINIAGTTTTGITIDTCSGTNIAMTGTITKGIDFASATPAFSDSDDAFISVGTWNDAYVVSSQSQHFVPIQVHLHSNTSVAKDIAAARLRVDTATANTLNAVGCLQLRQSLAHDLASSAILNASVSVDGAVAVQTGSLLGGYFSIEGTGAITKAGDNDCTPLVAVNNNTGGGVDNVFVAMMNGTGQTVSEIIHAVCEHGTATIGVNIEKTSNGTALTTGLQLTGAMTTYIATSGTGATASARVLKGALTVEDANYGDGYGLVESELTLTGTVAGSVSALTSWINMVTVTTGSNLVCAQSNGLYSEVGGVLTGGKFVFGMRADCLLQTNGGAVGAEFYPFSIVNNTNITTALIDCNAASSDLGEVTNAGSDLGTLVPLFKDGAKTGYVKIYSLA